MHHRDPCWNRWRALSGLIVLLLHLTATAQTQTRVQASLQKVRQLYDTFQYESALEELRGARQHAQRDEEIVPLLLYKGIFLAELLRKEEASAAFTEALRLRPDASLPENISPKINLQFEAVRAALAVSKPEPEGRPSEPALREAPRPPAPAQPQKALAGTATPATPSADAAQAEKIAVQALNQIQLPATLPPINVVLVPNQEVNIVPPAPPDAPLSKVATPAGAVQEYSSHSPGSRILIPAGAGGALVIAGGVFWGLARKELSGITKDPPHLETFADAERSASRGRTYEAVGFSLLGAGLVGLGLAASLYAMDENSPVDLSVGTTGTVTVLQGRWR